MTARNEMRIEKERKESGERGLYYIIIVIAKKSETDLSFVK